MRTRTVLPERTATLRGTATVDATLSPTFRNSDDGDRSCARTGATQLSFTWTIGFEATAADEVDRDAMVQRARCELPATDFAP